MKKENKVMIKTMQARLQARMHYKHPEQAFNILLICYAKHRGFSSNWAHDQRKTGRMSRAKARDFAEYVGYPIDQN